VQQAAPSASPEGGGSGTSKSADLSSLSKQHAGATADFVHAGLRPVSAHSAHQPRNTLAPVHTSCGAH